MSVKIRLKRLGNRNRAFFRLVASDIRAPRDGGTIEDLGWYDPLKDPKTESGDGPGYQVSFKEERILHWMHEGAQLSETARSLLKRVGLVDRFKKEKAERKSATGKES